MADEDTALLDEAAKIRDWRFKRLRQYGYNLDQRNELMDLLEAGEVQWDQIRHLDDLGCPVETAWWVLS